MRLETKCISGMANVYKRKVVNLIDYNFVKVGVLPKIFLLQQWRRSLYFTDGAGIQSIFTGSETLKLEVFTSLVEEYIILDARAYSTESVIKNNSEMFSISAVSEEFIKNEGVNVFGSSETVFKNNTETENIVSNLLKNDKFLGTKKECVCRRHSFDTILLFLIGDH